MSFIKDPPQDGDTILHCGHLGRNMIVRHPAHWFKFEGHVGFERPDGSHGEAEWFVACEPCFIQHGEKVATRVRGDDIWTGDAPAIEKVEN